MTEEAAQNAEATATDTMASLAGGIADPVAAEDNSGETQQQTSSNQSDMDSFIQKQTAQFQELAQKVEKSTDVVDQFAQREQQRILDEAVDNAVAKINDGVDGDARLADSFLNSQYQRDPNFQKVFDNRDANPEAYEKALGILKTEWQSMNQRNIDPQVAENQRALRESQQSGSTYQQPDRDRELSNMADGDFMREMRGMIRSG